MVLDLGWQIALIPASWASTDENRTKICRKPHIWHGKRNREKENEKIFRFTASEEGKNP
jgi:hypothetical protein